MINDLVNLIPVGIVTGLIGWFGKAYLERLQLKSSEHRTEMETDATIEQHRDGLTFQLLDAARQEISQMRNEVEKLRPMESHLYHLLQALEHLEAILQSDQESRFTAERNAKAFLARMRLHTDLKSRD